MPVAALYGVLVLFWGSTFLWIGIATDRTSPFVVAEARLLVGALTAAAAVALIGPATRAEHAPLALRPWLARGLVLSMIQAAIPFVLMAYAQRDIPSSVAAIINSGAPLWVALVALIGIAGTSTERLPPWRLPGLLVGIAGVAVLVGGSPGGQLGGQLLMVAVVVIYASGGLYAQRALSGAPPHAAALLSTALGAMVMLPFGIAGVIADPPDLAATAALIALGVLPTGLGYLIYFTLIRRIGTTRSLTVTYLMPFVAIALGVNFLDERVRPAAIAGLVLILFGVAIVNGQLRITPPRRRQADARVRR
jgi:drug/metabolite transporter (DMT)-like permease